MKALLLLILFFLSSCASYVQSVHRQIDNENKVKRMRAMRAYQARNGDQRPIQNPVTLNGSPTANTQRNYMPGVRRQYNSPGARRYKANDLVDNSNDGSLWSGKNSESFLFVNNNLKRQGDIVIIEVLKDFKEKIQDELKRNFPERKSKKKTAAKAEEKKEETPAATAAPSGQEQPNKVYDKISTTVVEQVNQDYFLVRGRKEVMYKKFKRYFEVQAIVSQKDISSRDTVQSVKLLEPKINVLRY